MGRQDANICLPAADVTGHHWELARITVKSEAEWRMMGEGEAFLWGGTDTGRGRHWIRGKKQFPTPTPPPISLMEQKS